MARILLIDDDVDFGQSVKEELEHHGYQVEYVESAQAGLDLLSTEVFDVVLVDNRMPGMTGLEFLRVLQDRRIDVPVILMTKQGTSDTAIEAMNRGAFDYVDKPLELDKLTDELLSIIPKAIQMKPIRPPTSPEHAARLDQPPRLLGKSEPMMKLYKQIGKAANSDLPVLIYGETGTGKELVARAIHEHGPRQEKPFVVMNCTEIPESLFDAELFGHEPGAYTDAPNKLRKGRLEYADSGVLFLDEVGEIPLLLQAKLLRVLEYQEVVRIGSNEPIRVNVRIVSASHRDLPAAVKDGTFREDLYYRLQGHPIHVPPLRERGSDLKLLGHHFLVNESLKANRPQPTLHESSLKLLRKYSWPGNVRELQNVIRRAVRNCRGAVIMPEDLDLPVEATGGQSDSGDIDAVAALRQAVQWSWESNQTNLWSLLRDMLERELLKHALKECGGNQTHVAERLGMVRNTVRKRIRHYGLD